MGVAAKAWTAIGIAVLMAIQTVVVDDSVWTLTKILTVVLAFLGAVGVWVVPTVKEWPAAKTVVAVLTAAAEAALTIVGHGGSITLGGWITIVLAALTALGVPLVPNTYAYTARAVSAPPRSRDVFTGVADDGSHTVL